MHKADIASWRARNFATSVSGRCNQRLSNRLPIAVTLRSITDSSVLLSPPSMLISISRLLRVAASRMTLSARLSCCMDRMCGRFPRCVSFTYCSKHPAALSARSRFSQPKPCKSCVWNWAFKARCALCESNSQAGWLRAPRRWVISGWEIVSL